MWQQWVNALLGLWVIASPFIDFTGTGLRTNLVITGVAVVVLALWSAMEVGTSRNRGEARHRGESHA